MLAGLTSGFTEVFTKAGFGPQLRKEECIQHLLPRKNQTCQLLFHRRGQACSVTPAPVARCQGRGCPGACLRRGRVPGAGGSSPCLCAVSRQWGVPRLLHGNFSLRNTTLLLGGDKRHRFCSQGLKQQKHQQPPRRVGLGRCQSELSCSIRLPLPAAPALSTHPAPTLALQEQISPLRHPDCVTNPGEKPFPSG